MYPPETKETNRPSALNLGSLAIVTSNYDMLNPNGVKTSAFLSTNVKPLP